MTMPCVRVADIVEVPTHHDPDVQAMYVTERVRAAVLGAAAWERPVRVWVRGFPTRERGPQYAAARLAVGTDPVHGKLEAEVLFADEAPARPHRMRVYAPKGKRSPNLRLECVHCGARAELVALPDETAPVYDSNGVLHLRPVVSDPIEPYDMWTHYTFEAGAGVVWPAPEDSP